MCVYCLLLVDAEHCLVAQLLPLEPFFQCLLKESLECVRAIAGGGVLEVHLRVA